MSDLISDLENRIAHNFRALAYERRSSVDLPFSIVTPITISSSGLPVQPYAFVITMGGWGMARQFSRYTFLFASQSLGDRRACDHGS